MAEAWRSKPFPQTVSCQICTLELTIPSPEVIPFLSCEACGATPCARLCGRWFASEQGAAKHTLSCGRMAARKPKAPVSPKPATSLPVHGLLEGAAPPAPSPVVTPPPSNVVAAPTARDAAAARAAAAAPKPKPKPKARPKKRAKREAPPPEPEVETEPLPPAPADDAVAEGAALAPRAFREKLSKALDKLGGRYTLETSPGVRGNLQPAAQVCASGQRDAHYGAVLPALVVSILRHARFQPGETFADVGSGIGTAVLQTALTTSCARATGVEVVQTRHEAALRVHAALRELLTDDERSILEAKCALCLGDAFSDSTSAFLASCDVLFVNNASGTMAPERVAGTALDEQLANVAKRCRVGSRLIAMDRIPLLDECNAFRLEQFYSSERAVTWTDAPVPLYVYMKRADTWTCRRCTFANPLMDDYHFITECQACSDEMRSRFGLNDGERISGRRSRSPRPA